ncbi:MAG: 50S ribosomal protein L35ae [Candidatus Nanoarchaeia archaeon]|nr:50S ribosomal protein L35ae [Candidatus Nanoarchaeia archaeon]
MEGLINNFRRGDSTISHTHMIVIVKGVESKKKASDLIGKKVTWKSPAGKEILGKVAAAHGNSGALRVIFEKGMPGQAIGTKVTVA